MPSSNFFSNLTNKRRMSKRIKLINRLIEITNAYKGLGDAKEADAIRNRLQKELVKCQEARKTNIYDSRWLNEMPKDNRDVRETTLKYLEKWFSAKFNYLPNSFVKDLNEIKGKNKYTNYIQSEKSSYAKPINNKQSSVTRGQNLIHDYTVENLKNDYEIGNKISEIEIPDRSVSLYQNDKVHSGKKIVRNNAFKSKVPPRVMRKANTI